MAIHETDLGRNRHALNAFNHGVDLGYNQATVAPANFAAVKTGMSALAVHETQSNIIRQINANLDVAFNAGILANSGSNNVAVGTTPTNAAFEALFTANDPNLSPTERRSFAFQG